MNSTAPQVAQMGILDLVSQSGPMAKLVLFSLLAVSVLSWALIFMKMRQLKSAGKENTQFLNVFWHGKSIEEIFGKADKYSRSPVAAVFKSGVKELKKVSGADGRGLDSLGIENVSRSLNRATAAEVSMMEKHLGWLATTASAAPFVGLFGTVWGIMNSFQSIGATGAANLAVVAPGISEALVTTATGIGAAIPAVIAYNAFANQIRRLAVDMECFSQDFLNIVQRSATGKKSG
jgi:biopolymer transport protein TolQ